MAKPSVRVRVREAWAKRVVQWQVAHEQRVTARANVRAGNYTNGMPMSTDDRAIYHRLTQAASVSILFIAVLIGALIALAVVGK